ncbi:MAG: D-lyxose/D-mannose family sugar isomerase [Oscillibacter sp.]|nr:D-lyxose/D-mannose family sugar isomerase [Oscillibacter sp.]
MKRSEINAIMREAEEFIAGMKFQMPPFVFWTPEDWATKGKAYDEIRDNMLGWDITDFGSGDYEKIGLLMITLRNGNFNDKKYIKPYAEKLLIVKEGQITPFHFHWSKMEDIINRGGGNLMVQVYNSTPDEQLDLVNPVTVRTDGYEHQVEPGAVIRIEPGQSISLPNGQYHKFWGEEGTGMILLGEVSKVNDDRVDNRFYEEVGRFPDIDEDEAPLHLLGNEYPVACD